MVWYFKELIWKEFYLLRQFAASPCDDRVSAISNNEILKRVFALIAIELPIMFVIVLITALVEELTSFDLGDHKLEEIYKESPIFFILSGVILAPIIEEFFFRFFITFRFAFYFILPLRLVYGSLGIARKIRLFRIRKTWEKAFPYVFYLSVAAFGLVHITNFEDYKSYLWAIPFLTLPQLVIGVFLGYTRIRYGFRWSILFHALHNGILLVPAWAFEG
ncbi:MAG: CPBP family glutamic-type intramembrane protease [Bacteroidota bacterium]